MFGLFTKISEYVYKPRALDGDSMESGWSTLEPGLIDRVVRCLKRSQSWNRNAPSLRLLNKHWCLEVEHHVDAVAPHHSRVVVAKDLPSLLKFRRLTSLDATRFVTAYEAEKMPSICILSRLSNLSRLKLASDSWSGIGIGALIALSGISSLILETKAYSHVPERDLIFLSNLPLRELSIRCPINGMGAFFRECRSLEVLNAQALPADIRFPYDVAWMNGLTSLKLSFRTMGHNFELPDLERLSQVTTLTDLDLSSFCSGDLDWLVHLSRLKSLKIIVATVEVLTTVAFLHVLQRLRHFHLTGTSHSLELGPLIRRGARLQTLYLNGFKIDCHHLKDNLGCLENLSLHRCSFQNSRSFFADLQPLKHLAFQCQRDPFSHLHLEDAVLSQLTVLKLALQEVGRLTLIARLTNLTSLGLRTMYPLSLHALHELGSLPSLVEFGLSPPFPESGITVFLKMPVLTRLEMLYLSDETLKLDASSLQLLKDQIPRLKIETGIEAFDVFMKST